MCFVVIKDDDDDDRAVELAGRDGSESNYTCVVMG